MRGTSKDVLLTFLKNDGVTFVRNPKFYAGNFSYTASTKCDYSMFKGGTFYFYNLGVVRESSKDNNAVIK